MKVGKYYCEVKSNENTTFISYDWSRFCNVERDGCFSAKMLTTAKLCQPAHRLRKR